MTGEQRAILTALADPRGAFGWHREYADALPGAWKDYLVLKTGASKIAAYEAQRIPALLQTPAYARELAEADPGLADQDARARVVDAVPARRKAMLGDHRPEIDMIIGEAALRQEVGGPEVMKRQLADQRLPAHRRLRQIGIRCGQARSAALFQLATDLPAAVLARLLGIHITVAVAWQRASVGDWAAYAAEISKRHQRKET